MTTLDRPVRWDPVPQEQPAPGPRPLPLPLPQQRPRVAAGPEPATGSPARRRCPPQRVTLTLTPPQVQELARRVPQVVGSADPRLGDEVVVDLADAARVHLSGLALLLCVLWRRVGPSGHVTLLGGTTALRSALGRLGITPERCRVDVYGAGRRPALTPADREAGPVPRQGSVEPGQRGAERPSTPSSSAPGTDDGRRLVGPAPSGH